jgi:GntR family transcriptional regulator
MMLRKGPIPLYYQIKNILKSRILSNEFKEDQRFPSETELCSQYAVSRATVRQALSELVREGLIYRDQGKGSFVTDGVGLQRLSLKGTIENLIASGEGSHIKVVEFAQIDAPPNIKKTLKLGEDEKTYRLGLVRFIPKGIFGFSHIFFPESLGQMISPEEIGETTEIITLIEEKLNTRVHRANQTIDIGFANKDLAKYLSIKTKTSLLLIERDYFGRNGAPLFASITFCRPDLYKYRIELTRT